VIPQIPPCRVDDLPVRVQPHFPFQHLPEQAFPVVGANCDEIGTESSIDTFYSEVRCGGSFLYNPAFLALHPVHRDIRFDACADPQRTWPRARQAPSLMGRLGSLSFGMRSLRSTRFTQSCPLPKRTPILQLYHSIEMILIDRSDQIHNVLCNEARLT